MSRPSQPPESGKRRRGESGFTLLEVMLAAMMLTVGAVIAFPTLVSLMRLSRLSNEVNIAMFDLEEAIEDMHSIPFQDIDDVYFPGQGVLSASHPTETVTLSEFQDRHLQEQVVTMTFTWVNDELMSIRASCTWSSISNGAVTRELETSRGSS
ncbi:MAG: prepilin-type N-terminal cleavage/methylation domain-containing protein [Planctomycetota bacterium]